MEKDNLISRVKARLERRRPQPENVICKNYHQLQNTPSGDLHAKKYMELKGFILSHQDDLLKLIFSNRLNEREIGVLLHFGGHGGSVAKEDNLNWIPFMSKVRERQDELPESVQDSLDWLKRVHDW